VSAWSGDIRLDGPAIGRTLRGRYDVGGGTGVFREERITVTAATGIDRVALAGWGPPGHMLLVDDVEIDP